jgi:flagellar motility protein MotE (MotC chaperone)
MKVVVATHNPAKLRELEAILAPELELVAQATLGIPEAEEPHETFVENALAKARGQYESKIAHLQREQAQLERRIEKEQKSWESRRETLEATVERARKE